MWVYVERKENNTEHRELLRLEPVSLVVKNGTIRWLVCVERSDRVNPTFIIATNTCLKQLVISDFIKSLKHLHL